MLRRDCAKLGVRPARQRLETDNSSGPDVQLRLEFDRDFLVHLGVAQGLLDSRVEQHFAFVVGRKQDRFAAPVLLAEIQRIVGALVEPVRVHGVLRIPREADRRRKAGLKLGQLHRRLESGADLGAQLEYVEIARRAAQEQREFIAAKTRDGRPLANEKLEPRGAFPEHAVADGVAVKVVDRLEAVQIDDPDDQAPVRLRRDNAFEPLEKFAPVRQSGQAVGVRQQPVLASEVGRAQLGFDQLVQIARRPDQDIAEEQGEHHEVDRHEIGVGGAEDRQKQQVDGHAGRGEPQRHPGEMRQGEAEHEVGDDHHEDQLDAKPLVAIRKQDQSPDHVAQGECNRETMGGFEQRARLLLIDLLAARGNPEQSVNEPGQSEQRWRAIGQDRRRDPRKHGRDREDVEGENAIKHRKMRLELRQPGLVDLLLKAGGGRQL